MSVEDETWDKETCPRCGETVLAKRMHLFHGEGRCGRIEKKLSIEDFQKLYDKLLENKEKFIKGKEKQLIIRFNNGDYAIICDVTINEYRTQKIITKTGAFFRPADYLGSGLVAEEIEMVLEESPKIKKMTARLSDQKLLSENGGVFFLGKEKWLVETLDAGNFTARHFGL